ncbi:MAG TPA: ABC transporter permease [Bryobacteraceae bacterium]|nr:ABC transporter permease [Bryobacteraceae bacterium]
MRFLRILAHRFHSLFRRSRAEAELEREIDLHIGQLVKEHMAEGMTEAEAMAVARREFGPAALAREQCRDMRRTNWIDDLARDLAFAWRVLRKSPVFTLTALASLALGIGANTAIYSFIDAIMVRALPIAHPENLVVLNWRAKGWPKVVYSQHGDGDEEGTFPYQAWELLRDHNDVFSTLFAFAGAGRLNIVARNQAFLGGGEFVSGNYFSSIGAPPAAGRLINIDDDRAGAPAVAVISYRFWERTFDRSPRAVGQTVLINRNLFRIAGVAAPEFYGVDPRRSPDIYVPLHTLGWLKAEAGNRDWFHAPNTYWVEMMGRLRPGLTLRQAEVPLAGQFHRFVASTAANNKERANLPALWLEEGGSGIDSLRRQYSRPLFVLITMTGLILAIACANLANLLLSRATVRRREIAVRLSLGAGRWRVVRQLLAESILISLCGGIVGLFVAAGGIRFLTWLLSNGVEGFTLRAGIDVRILLFATLVSIVTGILFGLVPAIQATRVDVTPALKESRAVTARVRRFGLSHVLVAGQIAVSLLLVIAAGLFVRTLARLHSVAIGFNTENLLLFSLNASQAGYDQARGAQFYERMRRRFEALPGVRAATITNMPLVAEYNNKNSFRLPGVPVAQDRSPSTSVVLIGRSFFETMGIPILLGRPIGPQDTAGSARCVVVNEVFAGKFFPGVSPIGRHFVFDGTPLPTDLQIVGVAKNSLYSSLKRDIPPVTYVPSSQPPHGWMIGGMYYEVRTAGDPLALANTVRKLVHQADPALPVADLTTQVRQIDSTIAPERAFADLCTCFGILALLIACVGLYGAMAYSVARRTNEIGIRIALGAERRRVLWMVLREVLALCVAGLAIGFGIALETARFVASFLFGVRPSDPFSFGLSAAILVTCALAAGYAPAWRASRIDPMQALRHE